MKQYQKMCQCIPGSSSCCCCVVCKYNERLFIGMGESRTSEFLTIVDGGGRSDGVVVVVVDDDDDTVRVGGIGGTIGCPNEE